MQKDMLCGIAITVVVIALWTWMTCRRSTEGMRPTAQTRTRYNPATPRSAPPSMHASVPSTAQVGLIPIPSGATDPNGPTQTSRPNPTPAPVNTDPATDRMQGPGVNAVVESTNSRRATATATASTGPVERMTVHSMPSPDDAAGLVEGFMPLRA